MALQHRREAAVRPRFLLALTLSTVTACAVAAPLALQALNADDQASIAGSAVGNEGVERSEADLAAVPIASFSLGSGGPDQGGIAADSGGKAQASTTKSGTDEPPATIPSTSVLSNETTVVEPATTTVPPTTETTPTPPSSSSSPSTSATTSTSTPSSPTTGSTSTTASTTSSSPPSSGASPTSAASTAQS